MFYLVAIETKGSYDKYLTQRNKKNQVFFRVVFK